MLSTANGHTIVEATVTLPRAGVWHADLVVDTQTASDVTGAIAVSLLDGELALAGTARRPPQVWRGLTRVRMAAGAAGFGTVLAPQGYSNAPLSVVVGDILNGAGESLASSAMSLSARMNWARMGGLAGDALAAVAHKLQATWRSLPDGTVWIGTETWPGTPFTDYQLLELQPEDGRLELVTATPTLLPGTSFTGAGFTGGNVGRVVYRIRPDAIRAEVFFE